MRNKKHIEEYIQYMITEGFSSDTINTKTRSIGIFNKWLNSRNFFFTDVIDDDLTEYKDFLLSHYATSSAGTHLVTVKRFYTWMKKTTRILINPAEDLKTNIATDKLPVILSIEEITKLFDSISINHPTSKRTRAMLELAYSSLLRRRELVDLKLTNLDLKTQTVTVIRKNNKQVSLPFGDCACEALKDYINTERKKLLKGEASKDLWITARSPRKVSYKSVDHIFKRVYEDTGFKLTEHCLRRSGATHMIQNGASLAMVQMMLSHTTYKAMKYYLRLDTKDLREELKKSEVLK